MAFSNFFRVVFLAIGIAAVTFSVSRLLSINNFSEIDRRNTRNTAINSPELGSYGFQNPDQSVFEGVINDPFSSHSEVSKAAVKLAELAETANQTENKIVYLCKALEALSAALRREPLRSRTLVTWANLRQLLGSYRCPGDGSEGLQSASFEKALELALSSDPLDQQALFNSALVFLWAGQKEKAYPVFKRVLELGTDSSVLQRQYIYSLASDSNALNALIPARLPQVIDFTRYTLSQPASSPVNNIKKSDLWQFQTAAVKEFEMRYKQGLIDAELFSGRLLDFWKLSRVSAVTPLLDKLLGEYYGSNGYQDLAAYFRSRSHFTELEIVSALRSADSRPEKSSLANWDYQGDLRFDEFFTSVGFYLPRKKTLRRIELQSDYRVDKQLTGLVRILQSDDNNSWEDVTGVCTAYQVALPDRWVLYIDLPGSTKHFWKVHFANSSRESQFKGALASMVRAFGIGALDG